MSPTLLPGMSAAVAVLRRHPRDLRWIGLVLLVGLGATFAARWFAQERRRDFYREQLLVTAQDVATNLEVQAQIAGAFVEALAAFFENTTDQTAEEFNAFADRIAAKSPGLYAASWQAYVPGAQRAAFEASLQKAGRLDFAIRDASADGTVLVPAPERDAYVPITHVYAPEGGGPVPGLDLARLPGFMAPMWEAADHGRPAASDLIVIPSTAGEWGQGSAGFIVSAAVFWSGTEAPRTRIRGFTSASFLIAPMLAAATEGRDLSGLRVALYDGRGEASPAYELAGSTAAEATDLAAHTELIRLSGRAWTLRVAPTVAYFRGPMAQLPGAIATAGVMITVITALLVAHRLGERRQRRQIEHERRAAERKFHEVVENMAGAVTVFGAIGQGAQFVVWDMNAAAAALARPGEAGIIGCPLEEVFGPELHAHGHAAMRRVWATGQPEKLPPFSYARGGHVRWLGCNVFRLGAGEIVTVCNDLTAQKEVEQELRMARDELELALEASRVGLWSWDQARGCARIDARSAAILDVGSTQVLERADLIERLHADDLVRVRAEATAAIAQGREFEAEVRFVVRDGSWRRLCLRARPTRGVDGTRLQMVGCVWDATQRLNQEDNFQQRQRLESVATLAGGIAHDLNNALVPLSMGLDLLRLHCSGDPEATETVQSMLTSTRRAAAVVKQLSGLVRGHTDLAVAAQPRRVMETLREQLQDTFPPGIVVSVGEVPAGLRAVQAGGRQLHQVIQNLCVNAREAMRGHGTLTVEARALRLDPGPRADFPELTPGDYVAFIVQDTGPGIRAAIRSRIFDPFFTTKEAGRGAGLGLSTALSIVRSCRGAIRCDSEEGAGARFTVVVPVAPESAQIPAEKPEAPGVTLRGKTVLLADDEPLVREVARRVLELAGLRVLLAQDGREAVEIFSREAAQIDLVVLDLVMPEVDGPTAGAAIRRMRADVPVVGASGYAADRALEQARAAGFSSFLPKPYTMDGLLDALRAALKKPVAT